MLKCDFIDMASDNVAYLAIEHVDVIINFLSGLFYL